MSKEIIPLQRPQRLASSWPSLYWLVAYLALVAAVIFGTYYARSAALAVYGSPTAQGEWEDWRSEVQQMATQSGPVKRRVPKSVQPPALVLMRDHFAVCLVLAVVLSSVLFATFMVLVRGALGDTSRNLPPT
jgi:hypothetical protein